MNGSVRVMIKEIRSASKIFNAKITEIGVLVDEHKEKENLSNANVALDENLTEAIKIFNALKAAQKFIGEKIAALEEMVDKDINLYEENDILLIMDADTIKEKCKTLQESINNVHADIEQVRSLT